MPKHHLSDQALEEAKEAFWAKIAEHYPRVPGELSPEDTLRFDLAVDEALQSWLLNGGEPQEEEAPDMRCNQCEALMINNVYCHEIGCPNSHKVKVDGEWVTPDDDAEDW